MAINNRSFDGSEQREVVVTNLNLLGTALTRHAYVAPRPQIVESIKVSALGLSGAPTVNFQLNRFIVGSGNTLIGALCATLTHTAFGTSGLKDVTFLASLVLQAGDVIQVTSGVANTAAFVAVTTVVKNLQDIKSNFGTTY